MTRHPITAAIVPWLAWFASARADKVVAGLICIVAPIFGWASWEFFG